MIEDLFKRPTILARYREGPLAEAREEFLNHCAKEGYSRSMLRKIAWVLLAIARNLDIDHGNMTMQDIERAVDSRVRFSRRPLRTKESLWTRQMFIHFATEWLRRLGCLQQTPSTQNAFSAKIDAFASHMRDERGLSPVTISTRCERLNWFFGGLCPPRETLAAITVADVDAFIESKGKQGWTRASLAALASSLRSFFSFAEARGWCAPGITAVI